MPVRTRRGVIVLIAGWLVLALVLPGLAAPPANEHFERSWARTDKPVADGQVARTWMWGPEAFTGSLIEPYVEGPNGEREVQYFDKTRKEITAPDADPDSIWYVTNGLLVVELITGTSSSATTRSSNMIRRSSTLLVMSMTPMVPPIKPTPDC